MPGRHQLTELQLAIMRVVWDRSEATVQDIWEALHAARGLAQTTVATMLSRLERRGVVTRRAPPQARQYHYRAAVTEREVQHSMVGELTDHRVLHLPLGHRGAVVVLAGLGGGPPGDDTAALETRQHGGDGGLGEPSLGVQGFPDVLDRCFAPVPDDPHDGELQLGELMATWHARPRG